MRFTPKSEKEVSRLFEKGDYEFKVIDASEKNDKKGRPMLVLKLNVLHKEIPGKTNIVDCFLTSDPNFEFLIRHFAYSVGLEKSYEDGVLNSYECKDKSGIVRLGIKIDKEGQYPDKNIALDFLMSNSMASSNILNKEEKTLNDDFPF